MNDNRVILVGGPASLCDDDRIRHVADSSQRIKIRHGNGYEHFTATGERKTHDAAELPVFVWCARTKIAE